ncbi:MAG TPA: ImmA/IrrE family metallo-endopeptidase [Sphingobium sp.]
MRNTELLKNLADCQSPDPLLAAIFKQYPDLRAPIDIEMVARATGITEFGTIDAQGPSSALVTDAGKAAGTIACARGSSAQRRRFAIAHQLGHFLLKSHHGGRQCTNRDLAEVRRDTDHRKEEMQANRFAAGLLMPKPLFAAFVDALGKPTVAHLPMIAAAYDVTLEVAASRYADLTPSICALVFIKDGVVRYARPSRSFPPLSIQTGAPVPPAILSADPKDKIAWLPAEARDWLALSREVRPPTLTMQILSKANGFQLVMLLINAAAERRADEEAEKLATERTKFGQRR